mgnify:CR=1 FL=1
MLVTRIEDKFGNTVDYTYNANGQLNRIESSDNRVITLTYVDLVFGTATKSVVDKVTVNGRIWDYNYDANGSLNEVILPNTQKWAFDNGGDIYGTWREWFPPHFMFGDECASELSMTPHFITMTHPYGMKGSFYLDANCFGQVNVPEIEKANPWMTAEKQSHWVRRENRSIVLDSKILTFPDNTTYTWDYQYSEKKGLFVDQTATLEHNITFNGAQRSDLKSTKIVQPNGDYEIHYFDRTYGKPQNNLLHKEVYESDGKLLQRQSYTHSYSPAYGLSLIHI